MLQAKSETLWVGDKSIDEEGLKDKVVQGTRGWLEWQTKSSSLTEE